jgi:hypothetical protein
VPPDVEPADTTYESCTMSAMISCLRLAIKLSEWEQCLRHMAGVENPKPIRSHVTNLGSLSLPSVFIVKPVKNTRCPTFNTTLASPTRSSQSARSIICRNQNISTVPDESELMSTFDTPPHSVILDVSRPISGLQMIDNPGVRGGTNCESVCI